MIPELLNSSLTTMKQKLNFLEFDEIIKFSQRKSSISSSVLIISR